MQSIPDIPDDEISLHDLWKILIRRKGWILGFPLFAMITAAIVVTFMKPQWDATAVIRIGAVGQVGQQTIEPAAQVVERMKLKAFNDVVLVSLGLPTNRENPESTLYQDSFQIKSIRGTDLIELKVRGYSQANANRYANAAIDYLKKKHAEMMASAMLSKRQQLEKTVREISQIRSERDRLTKLMGLQEKAGFAESIVLTNTMAILTEDLRSQELIKANLEEQLNPMHTFPTSIIEEISISNKPVAPKKVLIILITGVLGLLIGVMATFLDHAWARKVIGDNV